MVKFDFVYGDAAFDEVRDYIETHKAELEKCAGTIDIDYDTYREVSRAGSLVAVVLRHNDRLVGFSGFYISKDLRDQKKLVATNHGLYLEKDFRKSYGERMITDAEKFLSRLGVIETEYNNNDPVFLRFLKKLGFTGKTQTWSKKNGK